uniref:FAD-binding oxidoreductase n=1 Tax=Actinotalea sp. C106 TaxID=2908644 RepID=UPI0020297A2B
MTTTLTNWAKNHTYRAGTVHEPRSVEEVQALVRDARARGVRGLRALGSRHCFNDVADGAELVALGSLEPEIEVDAEARTVRVGGGVRYGTLAEHLHARGWAVHNLASLPHISVAGAVATATHGPGDARRNLA